MTARGVVAIGRNEGERLRRCLLSVTGAAPAVVYVDSCSTDGSAGLARGLGVEVVELSPAVALTAALARNEGFARLMRLWPETRHVQFIDGDCELIPGWMDAASAALDADDTVAVVCGRLRERHPEATIYNRLCDIEWNGPTGPIAACGGIAMMQAERFSTVGGFNARVIAAEDDELCVRLRLRGWKVLRIAHDMAWHDAAITRFSQWWRRSLRSGHAFAQVNSLHGRGPMRHFTRELRRVWIWGLVVPVAIAVAALETEGAGLAFIVVYPLNACRIWRASRRRGMSSRDAWLYAAACVLGVFPAVLGILRFGWNRLRGQPSRIIEYKRASGLDPEAVRE